MAYKNEITQAIKTVKKISNKGVAVLKCTSVYPAQDNILNLNSILEYKKISNPSRLLRSFSWYRGMSSSSKSRSKDYRKTFYYEQKKRRSRSPLIA